MTPVLSLIPAVLAKAESTFCADVLNGLSWAQKTIPARWLYDLKGSELFEEITELPEYYPTRTERAILERNVRDMAQLIGPGHAVIEFGSGSSTKTPILLNEISPAAYVPIDISGDFLHGSSRLLAKAFPDLPIFPLVGDFTQSMELPKSLGRFPRLGFFPGSTIGNLVAPMATDLLRTMASNLGPGSKLLIGIDQIKSTEILIPAYNDHQGVTAKFNLNILNRINRELAGTIPVNSFVHAAKWNDMESRIEMHLEATRDVFFEVAGQRFEMKAGQTIHTENSIKYGTRDMRVLLRSGGWSPINEWHDDDEMFTVVLAEVSSRGPTP